MHCYFTMLAVYDRPSIVALSSFSFICGFAVHKAPLISGKAVGVL
jgi:hypothetical protein